MKVSINSETPIVIFRTYWSADETDEKVAFRFVPRPCTTAMIATEMPAAMSSIFDSGCRRFVLEKGNHEIVH